MIDRCRAAGLAEPEFMVEGGIWKTISRRKAVTPEVTPEVRLLMVISGEQSRQALQNALDLRDDEHFRKAYLLPALTNGLIEMTIPEKPRSPLQRYRLTDAGRALLSSSNAKRESR